MATYAIHENLIDTLEKKLAHIEAKCRKYGCEFHYERIGEEFREVEDTYGNKCNVRFILVEAEGTAIVDGWRFVAVIDHHENGNVIRQYDYDIEVPTKYRTTDCVCEHCNTFRNRKDTCLVYNDSTQEWKQVGKTCLQSFTDGLSASMVALHTSWQDELVQVDGTLGTWDKQSYRYYPIEDLLMYGCECIQHFGYQKSGSWDRPTGWRSFEYYEFIELGKHFPEKVENMMKSEISSFGFKAKTDYNIELSNKALEWIRSVDVSDNLYLHNLQVICKSGYVKSRDIPLLISLIPAYNRNVKQDEFRQKREAELESSREQSKHVGNIKDKLIIDVSDCTLVTSWDTQYGTSFLYRFVDKENNDFIWITGISVEVDKVKSVIGTVKEHSEYNGVKQTVLTRCKVMYD